MVQRVTFRDFEIRDVDFIYKAKNDKRINADIVGTTQEFTYEDAISWVTGCMKTDVDYKFWAICTNDEFQNIVGWCAIANIDYKNRKVAFRGLTIVDPMYRDGYVWYEASMFVTEYVFNILKFNKLYSVCLTSNRFSYMFYEYLSKSAEGILRQAICKNNKYYDLAIYGILKSEYEEYKNDGVLDYQRMISFFKNQSVQYSSPILTLEDFLGKVKEVISDADVEISQNTKFRDLNEWSSLVAIDLAALVDFSCQAEFDITELNKCETFYDLYNLIVRNCKGSDSLYSIDNDTNISELSTFSS